LKITDFGIVKLAGESSLTRTGFNPGTIDFMSPEQIRGLEVDARSDLYSLGVTLYQMLTGRLPFPSLEDSSEYEVLKSHVELPPQPITEIKPDVSAELAAIVMRSLEKNPLDRFQSAAESLEALLEYETRSAVKEKSVKQNISAPLQPTHSMTELLESDSFVPATTPIPAATTSAPRPAQTPTPGQQYQTNLMPHPPQRQESQVKRQSSRTGLIVTIALIAVVTIAATAYFLWKPSNSSIDEASAAVTNTSPITTPSQNAPTPQVEPVAIAVQQARAAEQEERYADAIKLYDDYLRDNPQTKDTDTIKTLVVELKKLQGLLTVAELELKQQDFAAAKRDFGEALKLRPESKRIQTGLTEAETKLPRSR
ncbi:MAG: protein kinase, partial [Acidobacteriota bacterium]